MFFFSLSLYCLSRLDEKRKLHVIMIFVYTKQCTVLKGSAQILKVSYCESPNIIYLTALIPLGQTQSHVLFIALQQGWIQSRYYSQHFFPFQPLETPRFCAPVELEFDWIIVSPILHWLYRHYLDIDFQDGILHMFQHFIIKV